MELKNFLFEVQDGIAVATVNRPQILNAMNSECWEELIKIVAYADTADEVKCLIITGAGEKAFVAGADINALAVRKLHEGLSALAQAACLKIEECGKPVIAAVNGIAFGGGCELAISCDIRVASEKAKFGLPEANLGILPGAGGTQRLAKLIGVGRAKEVMMAGRIISGKEAADYGLAYKVVAPADVLAEAKEVAKAILTKGPFAIKLIKRLVAASLSTDQYTGMFLETVAFAATLGSEDKKEGTTAFLEKRTPSFKGM